MEKGENYPLLEVSMERKLTAILSADVKGYSRLMGEDEEATIRTLTAYRKVMTTLIEQHRGRVVDSPGDNLLAEFASVVAAVRCAVEIQQELQVRNAEVPDPRKMEFRIGLNLGDVVVEGERLYGDGVNIAARLESLADPGGICISGTVYEHVENKLPLTYEYLGEQTVKNIAKPVRVWRVAIDAAAAALVEQAVLRQARHERPQPPVTLSQAKGNQTRRAGTAYRPWVLGGVGSLLLIVGTIVAIRYLSRPPLITQRSSPVAQEAQSPLPLPDKPSIVVLPFVNMSKDPEQEYFSDGLTEVLTGDLTRISSLFVIARNSAFTYKGKAVKVQDIGCEMGVRYVLEGSVQKADQRVRINAQLIEATTGYHLWSEQYDRPLKDIFALQDEIVQKIVTTLKLQLTLSEQGVLARKTTDNLEAYEAFLRGLEYVYRFTKEANVQARQMFEKAIELDPQYAVAYANLGWTYYIEWIWRWSQDPQTLEQVFAMAQKALALDDSLPWAHTLLSLGYAQKKQYEQAIAEGERAIGLDSNNAESYAQQAEVLNFMGRAEEALRSAEKAMRLNPRYPAWYLFEVGWAYNSMGRYEEAIAASKALLLRNPNFPVAYFLLADCYLWQWAFQLSQDPQTLEQALAMTQRAMALSDSLHWNYIELGYVYLWQKQYAQAIAEMERATTLDPNEAWSYAALAEVLSRVGRSEEALGAAEKAMRLNSPFVDWYLYNVGSVYYLTGRTEEAIAPLQRVLARYPNILGIHLTLAAVYSELGKDEEARDEAAEVLRLNPNFSLEVHQQRMPIKDPAVLERHIAALRKAGLK